jgi:L-lactate utilization protein LutB
MDKNKKGFFEKTAKQLTEALQKRRIEASYAETAEQAKEEILAMVPNGATVYRCGSVTLMEAGFWDALERRAEVEVINPFAPGLSLEESMSERVRGLSADFLVTGTNAITLDGRLVNLDRTGNRVAAMIFGPKKVFLAVGMNKVAPDLESAMARVKHHAAPVTASMVKAKTPCVADGLCHDCRHPDRLCNAWSIIEGQLIEGRIHVKLIGDVLGY